MSELEKSYCSHCECDTNQEVVHELVDEQTQSDDPQMHGGGIEYWCQRYQIVKCKGCDSVSFRQLSVCSEDIDSETGQPEVRCTSYPEPPVEPTPRPRGVSRQPKRLPNTPSPVRPIYRETVGAMNAELTTLAAAGLRATVEAICLDKEVDGGNVKQKGKGGAEEMKRSTGLDGKIAGLAENGHLTPQHAETLHSLRFMGNDAVHRLQSPNEDELVTALEIIEHTLDNLYELPAKRRQLIASRATRQS